MTIAERKEECWEKEKKWYGFFKKTFKQYFMKVIDEESKQYEYEFNLNGYQIEWRSGEYKKYMIIRHNKKLIMGYFTEDSNYMELSLLRPIMKDLCIEAANAFLGKEMEELERREALCEVLFDD